MNVYQLELRAAEGGDDAKLFLNDFLQTVLKFFTMTLKDKG